MMLPSPAAGREIPHGLGYTPKVGSDGKIIDCDLWSNFFESVCWIPDWLGGSGQQTLPSKQVTTTDPNTGQTTVQYQPDAPPVLNPLKCGIFQVASADQSTCETNWAFLSIVGVVALVVGGVLLSRR